MSVSNNLFPVLKRMDWVPCCFCRAFVSKLEKHVSDALGIIGSFRFQTAFFQDSKQCVGARSTFFGLSFKPENRVKNVLGLVGSFQSQRAFFLNPTRMVQNGESAGIAKMTSAYLGFFGACVLDLFCS